MIYIQQMKDRLDALKAQRAVRILALETSCDETAAAVVENGRVILSNAVYSQIDLHALYGGVVPEIASRAHVEKVSQVVDAALDETGLSLDDVDALAVTCGPGLVGALLIGVSYMKGLAYALAKPLVPVHHIEGHICANYLTFPELTPPFLCLAVSGGHSHLFAVEDYGRYRLIGCTQDDAAGEAFDKAARVLNLPYPGGPRLDRLAEEGNDRALRLPRAHTDGTYDFTFSGLKTAFLNAVNQQRMSGQAMPPADLAASFRRAVCDQLTEKTLLALRDTGYRKLALAGGVSANHRLRAQLSEACMREGVTFYCPRLDLCGDNGAMIGSAAYYRLMRGEIADLTLNAQPNYSLI